MNLGTHTLGDWIMRHRLGCAVGLAAVTVLLGWRALLLREDLSFETLYPSRCPEKEFSDQFTKSFGNVNEIVAVAITGGDLFSPEFLKALSRLTRRLEKLEHVSVVYSLASVPYVQGTEEGFDVREFLAQPPANAAESRQLEARARAFSLYRGRLLSEDGRYTAVYVQMDDLVGKPCAPAADGAAGPGPTRIMGVPDRRALIGRIEKIVEAGIPSGYRTFITGLNVVERDYARIIKHDKLVFQTLTVVVLALCFFLSFRSWRDTLIAVISLGLSAVCALGAVELIGGVIDIVNSVIFLMVLVVGTSNIVHMTNGFYREWRGDDGEQAGPRAAARMINSVGMACLMASVTLAGGFASLYSARIGTIARFGMNMAVAVFVTYLVSQVAMPLMLSLVRQVPAFRRRDSRDGRMTRLIQWLTDLVIRRWRTVMVVWLLGLGTLCFGIQRLYVETHAIAELPEESPTKQNVRAMENLAGSIGFEISVKSAGPGTVIQPEVLRKVDRLVGYLRQQPETIRAWSLADYVKTMNQAAGGGREDQFAVPDSDAAVDQFLLLYSFSPKGVRELKGLISQDRQWLRIVARVHDVGAKPYLRLKDNVESLGKELFPDGSVEVRVTSSMYLLHMSMSNMSDDLISSMTWAFVFVGLLVALVLRSPGLGVVAIPPNVVPLLATLGLMGLTGIALRVGTLVVFSLGLGMVDNTIHYLLTYRELRGDCADYRECTRRTIDKIGAPMMTTSLILIAGFLCTLSATFQSIWQMGVLCSFTVAVTLIGDFLVTPLLVRFFERVKRAPAPLPAVSLSAVQATTTEETR